MNNLVKDIKKNAEWDKEKLEMLIKKLEPLIYSMYKKYGYAEDSVYDAYQSSIVIMLEAVEDYDESRQLPFLLHFKNQLFYHYMDKVKESKKRSDAVMHQDYDAIDNIASENELSFESVLINKELRKALIGAVNNLTANHMWIIRDYYVKGKKLKDIAKEKDMHQQSLVKLKRRALDRLREDIIA